MKQKAMPSRRTPIHVFLSSPGDVNEERALALSIIEQLGADPDLKGRITAEAIAWEKGAGVPLLASVTPQEAINQGLRRPSECDIVVVVFWSRMGTPLPPEYTKVDGSRYLSGTDWEYEDAIAAARKSNGKPYLLVYRRMEEPVIGLRDPLRQEKIEQWEKVESFFASFVNADGSIRQGYHQYHTVSEFGDRLRAHLKSLIERVLQPSDSSDTGFTVNAAQALKDTGLVAQAIIAAHEWDKHGRDPAFLWPHERLVLVYPEVERLGVNLDDVTKDFIRPEADRLLGELDDPKTPHLRRIVLGDRLATIGDPRAGVGVNADGLPDIVWCPVKAGKVRVLGNPTGEDTETAVKQFRIAKYPITHAQYKAFVNAPDGYVNAAWWAGLAKRQANPGTQEHVLASRPAENVSWYDAMAFCRWLSARLGFTVRLPTEQEWQLAATGGDPENVYPWGPTWDKRRANTLESSLGQTTVVGLYPLGASPVGALDMVGNTWEWCLNLDDDPDVIDEGSSAKRVLRGGGCTTSKGKTNTTYRGGDRPTQRRPLIGFRIVAP